MRFYDDNVAKSDQDALSIDSDIEKPNSKVTV
jgi:hypothetical protein